MHTQRLRRKSDDISGRAKAEDTRMPPKRKAAETSPATGKAAKPMAEMQKTAHESDEPGWCSNPSLKMSAAAIAALDDGEGNDLLESDLREYCGALWLREYEITSSCFDKGSDTRTLVQYCEHGFAPPWEFDSQDDEDDTVSRLWMVEDAQKYMGMKYDYAKFGKRLEAMHEALKLIDPLCTALPGFDAPSACDSLDMVTVLLLGKNQPICRKNAIPALAKAGIVIQRRQE